MKIRLVVVPGVNVYPTDRPRSCRYCEGAILQRHSTVSKPIKDHRATEVGGGPPLQVSFVRQDVSLLPVGSEFEGSESTHGGVGRAYMYGLGLSCSAASHLLWALGVGVSKMSVWRDAQEAGEALREKRPAGRVRILGADDTAFKV